MITMPIAGALVDKFPVGRIVPFGIVAIAIGMFGLTQIAGPTPYSQIVGLLFVMGLGMGATMMPLFTTALKTLKKQEVARGSTLLNITQQIASSVGVAVISVVLTDPVEQSKRSPCPRWGAYQDPALGEQIGGAEAVAQGLVEAADAFASTFWVAWVLVLLTLVPAYFLPRRSEATHLLDDEGVPPAVVH